MNKPYVKQFNDSGELLNPLQNGFYPGKTFLGFNNDKKPMFFPNRAERRYKAKQHNNRVNACKRGKNSRLSFIQVVPEKWETSLEDNGDMLPLQYPQRIIIHKTNSN